MENSSNFEKAMGIIFVGGPSKATRFRPLSFERPKPIFPIAGVPMIYHHISALVSVGIRDIFLCGFYRPVAFQPFIKRASDDLHVHIEYLYDGFSSIGTGNAIQKHSKALMKSNPEHVIILHCDVICDFPLKSMMDFHQSGGQIGTVLGKRMPDGRDLQDYGVLVADERNVVLHYVERGERETFVSNIINCGVYVFRFPDLLTLLQSGKITGRSMSDVAPNVKVVQIGDILEHLALTGTHNNKPTLCFQDCVGSWMQVKRPIDALEASRLIAVNTGWYGPVRDSRDLNCSVVGDNVFVDPTAMLSASCVLGPNVVVGPGAIIGEGVRVKNALVLGESSLGDFSLVSSSVIGWRCSVGKWARLDGDSESKVTSVTTLGVEVTIAKGVHVCSCIVLPHKRITQNCNNEVIL